MHIVLYTLRLSIYTSRSAINTMRSAQCGIRFRTLKLNSNLLKSEVDNFIKGKNLNLHSNVVEASLNC
jgi:hypothetical protein